ncbi:MAG: hypothetical protein Q9169_005349 [Polycauliona sp. 2 TL-2023]
MDCSASLEGCAPALVQNVKYAKDLLGVVGAQSSTKGLPLKLLILIAIASFPVSQALDQGDAETTYEAFNDAFLTRSGKEAFYKEALNSKNQTGTWAGSLNILGTQDAYERTGDPEKKTLINELLTTWLKDTPTPWDWDGWNDDIGWFSLALVRGYQTTGTQAFLDAAKYGFDYAFERGWDTKYNDGGIWEEQPEYIARAPPPKDGEPRKEATKEALANDSLGKTACIIYQVTHDAKYLQRAQQIYAWVSETLFNHETGQINTGIHMNGTVNTATAVYNQGTFLDYANLLWLITGNRQYYNDAKLALDFGRNELTTNGVFSNDAGYLNTWADEFARGAGHFVRDNSLWTDYHAWMKQNAESILENRRSDLGITWNAWDKSTPSDDTKISNQFVSAMAWMQFTPATIPSEIGGIHVIVNQQTGLAIDSAGIYKDGEAVVQWGLNDGQNQRWLLTQNSDESWNIINLATWKSLDCPGGSDKDGLEMVLWTADRDGNQRWGIERQGDGTYKIENQASRKVLDGAGGAENGTQLVQQGGSGSEQQRWVLQ